MAAKNFGIILIILINRISLGNCRMRHAKPPLTYNIGKLNKEVVDALIRPKMNERARRNYMTHLKLTHNVPFQIEFDLSLINIFTSTDIKKIATIKSYLIETLLPRLSKYLSSLIKIKDLYSEETPKRLACEDIEFSTEFLKSFKGSLGILVTLQGSKEDGFIAWSYPCSLSESNNRPRFGVINYNPNFFDMNNFRSMFETSIHELFHVIGFNPSLFPYFVDEKNNNLDIKSTIFEDVEKGVLGIKSPKVLEYARAYFACDTLNYVPLEDEGSVGSMYSHWERSILMNEMMTASDITNSRLSSFTLALLEDSGWYNTNYALSEYFTYGRKKGCDVDVPNYGTCENEGKVGCFYERDHQGICVYDYFNSGYLRYHSTAESTCRDKTSTKMKEFFGEGYGDHSKCFEGNLTGSYDSLNLKAKGSFCYNAICETTMKRLYVKVLEDTYDCSDESEITIDTQGIKGTIICPGYYAVCTHYPKCVYDCEKNGRCLADGSCYEFN